MKKISKKLKWHYISKQRKITKKKIHNAKKLKHKKQQKKIRRNKNREFYEILDLRKKLMIKLYKKRPYNDKPITIEIQGEFGIEEKANINKFLDIASKFVDFNSRILNIDIKKCIRVWPSAITLFCSLKQWVELTAQKNRSPKVRSTSSDSNKVNSYLAYCGFYDYVDRMKDVEDKNYIDDGRIVKIERETIKSNVERREDQIVALLKRYSVLSADELEELNDIVITEIFNNVTEHGLSHRDKGWWVLAQYHEKHKFISICVADNGIGIKNSLLTGPQRAEIKKIYGKKQESEVELVKLAFEENVSGAFAAPMKSGRIRKRYKAGARKGYGLMRIKETCKKFKIPLTILSHKGYLFFDENGRESVYGSKDNRVFAGTMYHLKVKAK